MLFIATIVLLCPIIVYTYRNPNNVYSILLTLLHLSYRIYKLFTWISLSIVFLRKRFGDSVTSGKVRDDVKHIDKIPKHLAVIFWGKATPAGILGEVELNEVGQLCCWAWCVGIKVLSVYESEGNIKLNAHLLQSHIQIAMQRFFARDKFIPTLCVTALSNTFSEQVNRNIPDFQVNLVSRADGRGRMTEITKSLAFETLARKIKSGQVDVNELDRRLSTPQFSEPQLLITFSPDIDLQGFPPWHIKYTEIFHIPRNTRFDYNVFLRGLYKFSKSNQRFGR